MNNYYQHITINKCLTGFQKRKLLIVVLFNILKSLSLNASIFSRGVTFTDYFVRYTFMPLSEHLLFFGLMLQINRVNRYRGLTSSATVM